MVAALIRVVEDDHIAGAQGGAAGDGGADGGGHGPQMDGDVGRLGQQRRPRPAQKDGATVVEPLFDVGAIGSAAERDAHLFGHGGEEVVEDGQGGGVHRKKGSRGQVPGKCALCWNLAPNP